MPRKRTSKKPPRAREYRGPHTLEAVREFIKTDALQKAKIQAMETLSEKDQITLMEEARQSLKDALELTQRAFDAEAKRRGIKRCG
jgi:hypothetical protein